MLGPHQRLQRHFREACPNHASNNNNNNRAHVHNNNSNAKSYAASWRDILGFAVFLLTVGSNYFLLFSSHRFVFWNRNEAFVKQADLFTAGATTRNLNLSTQQQQQQQQQRERISDGGSVLNNKKGTKMSKRNTRAAPMVTPSFATASSDDAKNSSEPNCRRACGYYNNKIFFSPDGRAGLNDRLFVFESLLNLAGYLCATLHVSRPKHQLSPIHNGNTELDPAMPWDEFAQFTYANDQLTAESQQEEQQQQPRALVDWVNPVNAELPPPRNAIPTVPFYKRWVQLYTDSPSKVVNHFQQMEEHSFAHKQNRAFVWEISVNFYEWSDALSDFLMQRKETRLNQTATKSPEEQSLARTWSLMQPYIRAADSDYNRKWYWGCEYAKIQPPAHLQQMQERIVQLIYQQGPGAPALASATLDLSRPSTTLVGHFHIRRGDAIEECNTSLERIEQYLKCSFGRSLPMLQATPIGNNVQHVVVLLSSDERDQNYRRAVIDLVEKQQRQPSNTQHITITCIDFDGLVKNAVQREIDAGVYPAWRLNNFYLYRLISGLSYNTTVFKFRLQQRRSGFSCPECTNLTEQLLLH